MDLLESSSDEEYFPTAEELEDPMDESMDSEEDIDNDPDLDEDDDEYIEDPDDNEEDDQETQGADVERILRQSNPGLLRQIQQVLQHGIRSHEPRPTQRRRRPPLPITSAPPYVEGKQLMNSGEFGPLDDRRGKRRRYEGARTITQLARYREMGWRRESTLPLSKRWLPGERMGRLVARYDRHVYSGQFSHDGGFFYTASQDFRCRMYSTLNPSNPKDWKLYKTVRGEVGRWTITDATLSHDNRFLAYSSITPCVYFARTGSTSSMEADAGNSWQDGLGEEQQTVLDFSGYSGNRTRFDHGRMDGRMGIWSLRFSADGRELVAGASDQCLYVYDVEMRKITLRLLGHQDDINAVCFADPLSTNVLFSGSDDSFVKVWDRRSMAGGREAGCLAGHMEGITFVASKGDGRYVISNGKDQVLKLWDIRKMMERSDFDALARTDYSSGFDYRWMDYPGPVLSRHPQDCSVTTYSGHRVLKTLIRCHFSPPTSTGQQYLYSGSEDGRVHIWNLDGTIARVIDVGQALSDNVNKGNDLASGWWDARGYGGRRGHDGVSAVVRDVSWHPYEGVLVSSSWTSIAGESGAVTVHAWE